MRQLYIFILAIVLSCSATLSAQKATNAPKPKLAVVICVDGLQSEHLTLMWDNFSDKGFKRIASQGRYFPNVMCNYIAAGSTADYASLMTGTVPFYHGITGDKIYDDNESAVVSIVHDNEYESINGKVAASADHLQAMTVADALKAASPQSKVFSIALTPECGVMLGGHTANASVWIDTKGKLATSNYYGSLPHWASKMNNGLFTSYMQSEWKPMYAINTYRYAPHTKKGFDGVFYRPQNKGTMEERIKAFRQTPYCNTMIKDLAIGALREERLGTGSQTDMLCIQFTAAVVGHSMGEFNSAEREDLYLKLDTDLELLLNAIDQQVGLANTVIMLTGTQADTYSSETLEQLRISAGTFQGERAMLLLNGYLMSIHGDGRWVSGFHARHITLNKTYIEAKGLSMARLREETAEFMSEFDGVASAYTADQILRATGGDDDLLALLRNSYYKRRSGDVVFTLLPGWCVRDENGEQVGYQGTAPHPIPVYFAGMGMESAKYDGNVNITALAPTLCALMQIPQPNAARSQRIQW